MKKQKLIKKLGVALLITVVSTVIFTAVASWNPLNKWQLKLTNHLYGHGEPSENIVLVGIDSYSFSDEGLGRFDNWDRTYYANVIENLETAGAKVIGFDLTFINESQGISEETLTDISESNDSATDAWKETKSYLKNPHPSDQALANTLEKYDNVMFMSGVGSVETGIVNLPMLDLFKDRVLEVHGFYIPDDDDLWRRIPLEVTDINGDVFPAMSKKASELYLGKTLDLEGDLLINFVGPADSYKIISFADVYNNNFSPEDVKDKIVLIGSTTRSVEDHFATPTTTNEFLMPGVEAHAHAIQTILEENYLREQSVAGQAITIAILTLALTAAVMFFPIFLGLAATAVIIAGHQLSGQIFFDHGLIINFVYPTLALLAAYLATTLYKFMTEIREKTELKGAFSKYVNKDLANKILENPELLKLGGEKRVITVFFSDIANFTHFSEQCEPTALVEQLNEYFEVMAGVILKNNGNLNKFEGDAIMAFWGAPLDEPNHAILAAQSALECRAALTDLHARWQAEGKPLLDFRVGLSTGEVIAGNVGASERFDYTVMGDIVNLGARLESANKEYGTHVMIPDATVAELGDAFALRRLDRLRVKGKDAPVDVYELLARKDQLTEIHQKIVIQFHEAIEYYRNQKFLDAETRFSEILKLAPSDGPTKVYLARCQYFRANPPQGWDATWTLDHK